MKPVQTHGTVLKPFQQDAVENAVTIFGKCLKDLQQIRHTPSYQQGRKTIVADLGAVLVEAPTGSGKTLIMGHVAEMVSLHYQTEVVQPVIWLWFSPFAGLISQAVRTIRTEFPALRPKNPAQDRDPGDLKSGDVFVTTWASVAVANKASRKVRSGTEELPSLDELVAYARVRGFAIGVIIDEAHHTFRGHTQAFSYYRDVLQPELTILATATPRDRDVEYFCKTAGISNLRRIAVSRQQAIEDQLIKAGVKVAVFKIKEDMAGLIDFKRTALRQGVAVHRRLKETLVNAGLNVTPLLLVQADSDASIEQAKQWLKEMGFCSEGECGAVRVHTANEPDPYLATIAADETVEALIFKMAVATGFDAPRAFTLVSFRPSRDANFGVQIVGRILRVDRRLQSVGELPYALNYGYVFLADKAGQTGLMSAAQRINAIRDELAPVSANVAVVTIGDDEPVAQQTQKGQTHFFTSTGHSGWSNLDAAFQENSAENQTGISCYPLQKEPAGVMIKDSHPAMFQSVLDEEWQLTSKVIPSVVNGAKRNLEDKLGQYSYPLNESLGAPPFFYKAVLSLETDEILRGIVAHFSFDEDVLLVAQQSATKILMEEVEIFAQRRDRPEEIRAELGQKEIDAKAQQTLFKADEYEVINTRELHCLLMEKLRREVEQRGIDDYFDTQEKLRAGLHKILALRPEKLKKAISETIARHVTCEEVEPLPKKMYSFEMLDPARLNLYGVFPSDINNWERSFAEYLDDDLSGTVKWWHRNPPRKPYSIGMPIPGQPDFYPDFAVGIKDRKRGNGILLVETKREINDQNRNALVKAQAEHPAYARVMMLYYDGQREWKVVEYDVRTDKNFLDRVLRKELMVEY